MLQAVGGIGHLQKILLQIMIVLVGVSLVLCLTCLGYLMGKGGESFGEALEFVVVVLVASIPMAIEIVCTATLALGSRQLSGHGAIVTRLASIEEMAGMNMLCSDKTGTLTLNKMVIQEDTPIYTPGEWCAGKGCVLGPHGEERQPAAANQWAGAAAEVNTIWGACVFERARLHHPQLTAHPCS